MNSSIFQTPITIWSHRLLELALDLKDLNAVYYNPTIFEKIQEIYKTKHDFLLKGKLSMANVTTIGHAMIELGRPLPFVEWQVFDRESCLPYCLWNVSDNSWVAIPLGIGHFMSKTSRFNLAETLFQTPAYTGFEFTASNGFYNRSLFINDNKTYCLEWFPIIINNFLLYQIEKTGILNTTTHDLGPTLIEKLKDFKTTLPFPQQPQHLSSNFNIVNLKFTKFDVVDRPLHFTACDWPVAVTKRSALRGGAPLPQNPLSGGAPRPQNPLSGEHPLQHTRPQNPLSGEHPLQHTRPLNSNAINFKNMLNIRK